jgi:hypothetical protein
MALRRVLSAGVETLGFERLILFVSDLKESRSFYAGGLGLQVVFEDDVIVVMDGTAGRVVLRRNDRVHDERGTFSPTMVSAAGCCPVQTNMPPASCGPRWMSCRAPARGTASRPPRRHWGSSHSKRLLHICSDSTVRSGTARYPQRGSDAGDRTERQLPARASII